MRKAGLTLGFAGMLTILFGAYARAECVPIAEAKQHIGATRCVTGRVLRVEEGDKGVTYLDFCEDYRDCPFSAVVFASDLRRVGDVRQLKGKVVELHGEVKGYDGRAEIILSRPKQIGGEFAHIPPLPKTYDVEKKGHYSAGKFSSPKSPAKKAPKRQGKPVNIEDTNILPQ